MRLAAVCAIYGGYDLIPPVPEGVDDAVLITDIPVRSGWRNIVEPSDAHPRLAAKRPKVRPDLYTDCDASLWIDGSVHVRDGRFVRLVREHLASHELIVWDHPEGRDCFVQEARHCHDWGRWPGEPLLAQADHYLAEGMPEHFGLWALTCIARRHSEKMRRLGDEWFAELEQWSIRDQVSMPYVLWRNGITPVTFGIDQLENDLVAWLPHAEEIFSHRQTKLALESRLIHLESDFGWARASLEDLELRYRRVMGRRSVRLALMLANRLRWGARLWNLVSRVTRRVWRRP